ncbi:pyridoxal-dependent decarboxylase [Flavobacteriaceae bacterium F08102]|nr:pyridoxal-dependent decarboxylase [Flavobacteriaceae bacterium F08102]
MNTHWQKKSQEEIKKIVFSALDHNVNYQEQPILGVPATYLDEKVFSQDESFLKEAPFLTALIKNPNHIGCHTLDGSENFFSGTQEIERKLIEICAVDILKGETGAQDGYVASGGTEANIQALWIYRNYYQQEFNANLNEITILCSEDSHYSMHKASNLLCIDILSVPVDEETRALNEDTVLQYINNAKAKGKKYFLGVVNMMTTMFGSVDDIDIYVRALQAAKVEFKLHVDGAYGGFYYPFSNQENPLNFKNPMVTSVTLDAHKMVQAPYGTGVFLIRKGFMKYANTKEASYVEGEDYTLIGSRSGANAIAIWMILSKNGPFGWFEKIFILQKRAQWLCTKLDELGFSYFRFPTSNIITIKSEYINEQCAKRFGLVPDNHHAPKWYKVVIMDHVSIEKLTLLLDELKKHTLA